MVTRGQRARAEWRRRLRGGGEHRAATDFNDCCPLRCLARAEGLRSCVPRISCSSALSDKLIAPPRFVITHQTRFRPGFAQMQPLTWRPRGAAPALAAGRYRVLASAQAALLACLSALITSEPRIRSTVMNAWNHGNLLAAAHACQAPPLPCPPCPALLLPQLSDATDLQRLLSRPVGCREACIPFRQW